MSRVRTAAAFAWILLAALASRPGGLRAQEAPGPGAASGGPRKSLVQYIEEGGLIGHSIILCSIAGVALAMALATQIRRGAVLPPQLLGKLEALLEAGDEDEALAACRESPSFLSAVVAPGLSRRSEGWAEMEKAMQEAGEAETAKLHRKVGYLSLIAGVSPMLGLFGTVSGMIQTFDVIATSEIQPKPADLAEGISQALVTTYEGLLVAIPMTVLFNVFRNRVATLVAEAGAAVERLLEPYRGGEA
ncbi:MAG: MotA/TolQ/ExbB proton channel family protein [Planctomycetes bacterium]|nr:MotA/TolQ/ExbB proton channel family protein [Planctomycetota bacterium]